MAALGVWSTSCGAMLNCLQVRERERGADPDRKAGRCRPHCCLVTVAMVLVFFGAVMFERGVRLDLTLGPEAGTQSGGNFFAPMG